MNNSHRKWSTIEREMFAISWACKKFRVYLYGIKFIVRTDHQPLVGIFKKIGTIENTRMVNMILSTVEFIFLIEYFPGVKNVIADFGSRFIDPSEWDEPSEDDPLESNNEFYNFEASSYSQQCRLLNIRKREIQRLAPISHKVENK